MSGIAGSCPPCNNRAMRPPEREITLWQAVAFVGVCGSLGAVILFLNT